MSCDVNHLNINYIPLTLLKGRKICKCVNLMIYAVLEEHNIPRKSLFVCPTKSLSKIRHEDFLRSFVRDAQGTPPDF